MSKTLLAVPLIVSLTAVFDPAFLEGQTQGPPRFEVASIKQHSLPSSDPKHRPWMPTFQCDPNRHCGITGDRFREVSASLAELIVDAYEVKKFQIAGLPHWGDSSRDLYDIEAKAPDNSNPSEGEARLMLRTLLADRFQLRIHHETRVVPVYALVVSKNGFKLIPGQEACLGNPGTKNRVASAGQRTSEYLFPWAFYAQELSMYTDRPVIDESGLDGAGYCTADGRSPILAIMPETEPQDGPGSSLFTAVEEKWGMKLEPKKAPVDVLVIDSVEKPSGIDGQKQATAPSWSTWSTPHGRAE